MLYQIGKKFYIKVQGYYKEVDVKVEGDNLDVAPVKNGDEIEIYGFEEVVKPFDMMINKVLGISVTKPANAIDAVARGLSRINSIIPMRMRTNGKNITSQLTKYYEAKKQTGSNKAN